MRYILPDNIWVQRYNEIIINNRQPKIKAECNKAVYTYFAPFAVIRQSKIIRATIPEAVAMYTTVSRSIRLPTHNQLVIVQQSQHDIFALPYIAVSTAGLPVGR